MLATCLTAFMVPGPGADADSEGDAWGLTMASDGAITANDGATNNGVLTVRFVDDDDRPLPGLTITVEHGGTIDLPGYPSDAPIDDDEYFVGWEYNDVLWTSSMPVTKDMILEPEFEDKSDAPVRPVDPSPGTNPDSQDRTYTVRFFDDDDREIVDLRMTAESGETIILPGYPADAPKDHDEVFVGWEYRDRTYTGEVTVTGNTDFEPEFEDAPVGPSTPTGPGQMLTISFVDDDDRPLPGLTMNVEYGGTITLPGYPADAPVDYDEIFVGWEYNDRIWTSEMHVYWDMTLEPEFRDVPVTPSGPVGPNDTLTVRFVDDNDRFIASLEMTVAYGDTIILPDYPADAPMDHDEYFVGWEFKDRIWTSDMPVISNMVLEPEFEDIPIDPSIPVTPSDKVTVSFVDDDDMPLPGLTITVDYGGTITLPGYPEGAPKDHDEYFVGWEFKDRIWTSDMPVTRNMVLEPEFADMVDTLPTNPTGSNNTLWEVDDLDDLLEEIGHEFVQDRTLYIDVRDGNGNILYSWKMNNVSADIGDTRIIPNITESAVPEGKDYIVDVANDRDTLYLDFDASGTMPSDTMVRYNVSDDFANGTYVEIYYDNEVTNQLEYVSTVAVNGGVIDIPLEHCSSYVLMGQGVGSDGSDSTMLIVAAALVLVVAIVAVFMVMRRRQTA